MAEPRALIPQVLEHLNPNDDVETQKQVQQNLHQAELLRTQFRDTAFKSIQGLILFER